MALESGTRLSHYQMTGPIGRGGMGEVYRARDTKLGREVAIKVLPAEFARDSERIARLEREAMLLASLNHPNIAAIHGLEESGETRFLVLELVEGDTLADRLQRGAIPVEESLKLALQIAGALETAHEKGVVHRDLKPANIKITPEGRVKVLDFGLAKALAGEAAGANLSNSPTLSLAATGQGVILGTAAYMSPEQARGQIVDKRADIWSFGCLVFEMLTGRPTFEGDTVSDVLAGVLKSDPAWSRLPADLSPRLVEMLKRCLQKNPGERARDIGDVRLDLEHVLPNPRRQPEAAAPGLSRRAVLGLATLVPGAAALGGLAAWTMKPGPSPNNVLRFAHVLPPGQAFTSLPVPVQYPVLDISPDGSSVVYSANGQLFLRSVDAFDPTPVQGTDDIPVQPLFSPGGGWIAYVSMRDLAVKRIPATGGVADTLLSSDSSSDGRGFRGMSWMGENALIYAAIDGIRRISVPDGDVELLFEGVTGLLPRAIPGTDAILYSSATEIVLLAPDREPAVLFEGRNARFVAPGRLVYERGGALYATTFDRETLRAGSERALLEDGVRSDQSAVSEAGTLAYIPGSPPPELASGAGRLRTLVFLNPTDGSVERIESEPRPYAHVRVSPDGADLAISIEESSGSALYTWHLGTGPLRRWRGIGERAVPIWADNGSLVFASGEGIARLSLDSGAVDLRMELESAGTGPESAARDGTIAVSMGRGGVLLSPDGSAETVPVPGGRPAISPDGRLLAIQGGGAAGRGGGVGGITLIELENPGAGSIPVSATGVRPAWHPDGTRLYYEADRQIYEVPVETVPEIVLGEARPVVDMEPYYNEPGAGRRWDIAPDGRFVLIRPEGADSEPAAPPDPGPDRIHLVVGFDLVLDEKVPIG